MSWSFLSRLFIPLCLLAAALWAQRSLLTLSPVYQQQLHYLPYVVLTVDVALAIYFNRARQLAVALLLLGSYALISLRMQTPLNVASTHLLHTTLAIGIPLAALSLLLLPEKGLRSLQWLLPVVALPGAAVYLLLPHFPEYLPLLQQPLAIPFKPAWQLSLPASIAYGLAALSALMLVIRYNSESPAAIWSMVLFTFVTLAFFSLKKISLLMFGAAGVSLLISLIRATHELAFRDELTGLRSRRALNERLQGLGRRYVVAMVDVDHFKRCNDRYGHDVGDQVLKMVAAHLDRVRGATAYRYGGEEFCLVFTGKREQQCEPLLEKLRTDIGGYSLYIRNTENRPQSSRQGKQKRGHSDDAQSVTVTISIGAAQSSSAQHDAKTLLKAADETLYQAKKAGRNRVLFADNADA